MAAAPAMTLSLRLLLAVGGGYALTAALVALGGVVCEAMGLARSEAVTLSMMLGFLVYLGLLLWAFAERRLGRLIVVLGLGNTLLHGALLGLAP